MKKRSKKWLKRECDRLFSEIIRSDGKCAETGSREDLQCAHIISRSYHAVRWDFDNAICLSKKRHMYYTAHPVEWERFVVERIGQDAYDDLKERATDYGKIDYEETYERLKEIHANRFARHQ